MEQGIVVKLSYELSIGDECAIIDSGFEVTSFPFDRDMDAFWEQFYKCRKEDYITIGAETDYIESVKCYLLLVVPSIARKACRMRHCKSCQFGDSYYDVEEASACELCTKAHTAKRLCRWGH